MIEKQFSWQGLGRMNIVTRQNEHVATFEVKGTVATGKGEWTWFKDDQVRKKIENAITAGKERLGNLEVSDMVNNAVKVKVWKGFSGMYGGLINSLPTFGLDVDRDTIQWPGGILENGGKIDDELGLE